MIADQIAVNHRKAESPRQSAMLGIRDEGLQRLVDDRERPTSKRLREHGFTDEDTWDIGAIAAFFALSNRMANMTSNAAESGVLPVGRVPQGEEGLMPHAGALSRVPHLRTATLMPYLYN